VKKYPLIFILIVFMINACSSERAVTVEAPKGTIMSGDSIYYPGYFYLISTYQGLLKKMISLRRFKLPPPLYPFSGAKYDTDFIAIDRPPISKWASVLSYPEELTNVKPRTEVWIKAWIDDTGIPRLATILHSPEPKLNQIALAAAMRWKFSPGRLENKPVGAYTCTRSASGRNRESARRQLIFSPAGGWHDRN
jgi:hypothetical protein